MPESYVHRIGRTGRAGASGRAISFCDHHERAWLADEGHRGRALIERDYSKEAIAKRYDALIHELTTSR